ncbi:MAG: polymerase subunit delta, partial [Candidatus Saccharibacteria bacterium]|nr:polymerase subunit delta [Candidatus Saccharibacteria bacterium]
AVNGVQYSVMVITLTGTNAYGLTAKQRKLTADFEAKEGDMGLERLDGSEATIERIGEALTSLPFLSNKKMVLIRQGSLNKQFAEQAPELLANIPETTDVIVVEPKLDKRSSYYKFLKKSTDYQEFNELDLAGLARWLIQAAKEQGGTLSQADASFLVGRVGLNQQLLSNELDKLLLYDAKITRDSILALTEAAPQSSIFELLEAAFGGNTQHAMQLYAEQRALKVEPQQIIAMLTWQLHIVALIKTAGERSPEAIASEAKISPYVVKKSSSIARKLTLAELKQLVANLAEIDSRSKRESFSADDALQHYLLTLAT